MLQFSKVRQSKLVARSEELIINILDSKQWKNFINYYQC